MQKLQGYLESISGLLPQISQMILSKTFSRFCLDNRQDKGTLAPGCGAQQTELSWVPGCVSDLIGKDTFCHQMGRVSVSAKNINVMDYGQTN